MNLRFWIITFTNRNGAVTTFEQKLFTDQADAQTAFDGLERSEHITDISIVECTDKKIVKSK